MENNLNLTPEMLEKAKSATSATALLTIAQENSIALTAEQAVVYYTKLHPEIGALSDEELDNVSGGACGDDSPPENCILCGCTEFLLTEHPIMQGWECRNCGFIYY